MARKRLLKAFLSGLLLFQASIPAASTLDRIAHLLDEDAGTIVLVPDPPKLIEQVKAHPAVEAWNSEDVSWAFGATRDWLGFDKFEAIARTEIGYSLEALLGTFSGPAALVLWNEEGSAPWALERFGVVAQVKEPVEPAIALLDFQLETPLFARGSGAPYELAKEDYLGTILHYRKPTADDAEAGDAAGWARVGDLVAVARPLAQLKQLVRALVEGSGAQRPDAGDSNLQLQRRYPEADAYLQIDGSRLRAYLLKELLAVFTGSADTQDEEMAEAMAEANRFWTELIDALRLDTVQALGVAVRFGAQVTDVNFDLQFTEEAGAVKLLAYGPGPVRLPALLPDNLKEVEVAQLSLGDAWGALQELSAGSESLTVLTSQFTMGLSSASETAGIDLERILLDGFGDQLFYGTFSVESEQQDAEPQEGLFFGIELKDEQSVTLAMDALKESFDYSGQFETREYMDTRIYVERANEGGEGRFAYALTDGYLLLATDLSTLQEAVSRLRQPQRFESIWDRPKIKNALADMPPGASALGFSDPVSLLRETFGTIHQYQRRRENRKGGVCKPPLYLKPQDLEGYFDSLVSATYKEPGRYRTLLRLNHHVR